MAQQIGQVLNQPKSMASWQPSAMSVPEDINRILNDGIKTEAECRKLAIWAENTRQVEPKATPDQVAKHVGFLAATLPSKAVDEEGGKMKLAVYIRFLGEYSNDALAYLSEQACRTMDWMPTPHQCLQILKGYRKPVTPRDMAGLLVHKWAAEQFEGWLSQVKAGEITQADIDGAPEKWRRVAAEQCLLRRLDDGTYILRRKANG